jgi:hypothetical protein
MMCTIAASSYAAMITAYCSSVSAGQAPMRSSMDYRHSASYPDQVPRARSACPGDLVDAEARADFAAREMTCIGLACGIAGPPD